MGRQRARSLPPWQGFGCCPAFRAGRLLPKPSRFSRKGPPLLSPSLNSPLLPLPTRFSTVRLEHHRDSPECPLPLQELSKHPQSEHSKQHSPGATFQPWGLCTAVLFTWPALPPEREKRPSLVVPSKLRPSLTPLPAVSLLCSPNMHSTLFALSTVCLPNY